LPGIGQRLAALVEKLAGELVVDLVGHLPTGLIDAATSHLHGRGQAIATIIVQVERHAKSHNPLNRRCGARADYHRPRVLQRARIIC
jgi:ATP-dependent DNA helicase RecG